jgi:hypothetical protein
VDAQTKSSFMLSVFVQAENLSLPSSQRQMKITIISAPGAKAGVEIGKLHIAFSRKAKLGPSA